MKSIKLVVLIQLASTLVLANPELPPLTIPINSEAKGLALPPCKLCTVLVDSFKNGIAKTARGKHDGGDASWEEEKMRSYDKSEIRLTEIQELLCKDTKHADQCHTLAEKADHLIETWWLEKQDEHPSLHQYLCVSELLVCCPPNRYGVNCDVCTDCSGNGKCKGNGTRRGNGKCACSSGYAGEKCTECDVGYYVSFKDDTKTLCSLCHVSCNTSQGCTMAGPKGCLSCERGWLMSPERGGCIDIDECAHPVDICTKDQFCVNSEGSYSCLECDRSCNGCTGDGPDLCKKCTDGFEIRDGMCMDLTNENRQKLASTARYVTYFGLCVATCVIFQSSTWIASGVGLLVASYITLSEYWLQTNPQPIDNQQHLLKELF